MRTVTNTVTCFGTSS